LIVLFYTLTGGFLAVSITDVIQAILMMIALFMLPVVAIIDFGGLSATLSAIKSTDITLLDPFALTAGAFIGFIGIGLGSPGNPHILVRYMSAKDPEDLKFSAYIGTFWNAAMAAAAVVIGLTGRAYYNSLQQLPGGDAENLFPFLAQGHLHPILFGIIIASILAAIMSTADSMLLVCASSLIRDIYHKTINPDKIISEKKLVLLSRLVIVAIVVIAFVFGFIAEDLVFWLVLFAWGGLGAAFGPAVILSLFWKGSTRGGIISGMISGVITIVLWNQVPLLKNLVYELVPAFFISLLATIVVSYFTQEKEKG
jgi:sodium/proline symporter